MNEIDANGAIHLFVKRMILDHLVKLLHTLNTDVVLHLYMPSSTRYYPEWDLEIYEGGI